MPSRRSGSSGARHLTGRGVGLLTGGGFCLGAAYASGQPLFLAAGVLAVVLVGAAWVGAKRGPRGSGDVAVVRTLAAPIVTAGNAVGVHLAARIRSSSRAVMTCRDLAPEGLGDSASWTLDGHGLDATYLFTPPHRGRFEIGPLALRRLDPFVLTQRSLTVGETSSLLATPITVDLPPAGYAGTSGASGENRPRSFASGSAEDVTVRDYRDGDDLRRVHWRSTARTGELMVRREEEPWETRATVLIDNRAEAHRASGDDAGLELAISAAASVALHLIGRGFAVRLVSATGVLQESSVNPAPLLESLAELAAAPSRIIEAHALSEPTALTVCVVGGSSMIGLEGLRQAQVSSTRTMAMVVTSQQGGADVTATLHAAGWRCAGIESRVDLPQAWVALGETAA